MDINKLQHELQIAKDQLENLQQQKRSCDEELLALRERNREDLCEIERLNSVSEQKNNESNELSNHIRALEFEI